MLGTLRTTGVASLMVFAGLSALSAGEPFGFRGNDQGRFPDATPVTQWGKTNNVVWKTAMPNWSNASPAICGDRLFVCSEPTTLVCVNLADGKILWQQSNDYLDILTDPADQAKVKEGMRKGDEVKARLTAKSKELNDAQTQLNKNKDDAGLKTKVQDLSKEANSIRQELSHVDYALPETHEANGYASATPVTDGKHVWAVFGTGVVVCYDKDGKRIWGRYIEKPSHAWGLSASPVLAGDVLVVDYNNLFGLNAATGADLWKLNTPWSWGSPVAVKIADQYVVYTPKGAAVTAGDGKAVANGLGNLGFNCPVVQDGVLYYIDEKSKAYTLPATPTAKPEMLWDGEPIHKGRYYTTPLVYDGLIYAVSDVGGWLSVLDAKTGRKVYEKKLEFVNNVCYLSPTLAGKYIVLGGDLGKMGVIEPGREYKEVAQNALEPSKTTPVFAGSRMYVRTLTTLYCIGK